MTMDTKGKSKANEEEEHDPTPEAPEDSPAKPSGSGKPAPPYGDLPTKFEKFCSQFGFQRSEESHWSLVLIHISDTRDAYVIYHMDSIKTYHDHSQIGALLNTWLDRGLGLNMETSIVSIGIIQQTSNFDCGVHVLYIITKLIEAGKNGQLLEYLENGGLPKEWGTDEIVSKYRLEVRELLISLVESDT
ncbi:hypothetical protein R1sor_020895 [Riccia sorocarpa]|uniref:Ubiquitin-like protease family profile domain-containing protein n=1 Tax=Riccia sorocarpa TaxID=122646 RepID=A0ABD3GHL4_9MARC